MIGYKGFNSDLTYRGNKYHKGVNKCENVTFFDNPFDAFRYFSTVRFDDKKRFDRPTYWKVEAEPNETEEEIDNALNKHHFTTNEITLIEELPIEDLIQQFVQKSIKSKSEVNTGWFWNGNNSHYYVTENGTSKIMGHNHKILSVDDAVIGVNNYAWITGYDYNTLFLKGNNLIKVQHNNRIRAADGNIITSCNQNIIDVGNYNDIAMKDDAILYCGEYNNISLGNRARVFCGFENHIEAKDSANIVLLYSGGAYNPKLLIKLGVGSEIHIPGTYSSTIFREGEDFRAGVLYELIYDLYYKLVKVKESGDNI